MAHYAFLDQNNIVTEVIVGIDESDTSQNWEEWYGNYRGQICKRTSYNCKGNVHYDLNGLPDGKPAYRKNYAGVGYSYDAALDAFIPPQPYPSWSLNTTTCLWEAPISYPTDGKSYIWDESTQTWVVNEN